MELTALEIIRKQEQDYITGDTQISEHVSFSPKETIDKIEAYLNSKHITGERDSLNREKPFFNIVTAASNVWYRATDIDRKDIRIKPTASSSHTTAILANAKSKEWMRKSNFGVWLNAWGLTLAQYGSAVSKFVEIDGELVAKVVPWNRLIVDAIEFEGNPVIEKHYYTPAQLRKNEMFDQEQVESLIANSLQARETTSGDKADNKADYIEVYELHLEEDKAMLDDDPQAEKTGNYVQQVHICSFMESTKDGKVDYLDYTLYKGQEENPYHIAHLIKQDGRSLSIGAVEHLFEAQWMVNHNEKAIKDQLELASKMVFQTSDPAYQGKNTGDLDNGTILYHDVNQPLTQLANNSHDISSVQSSKVDWQNQGSEISSTPDSLRGVTPPSGTALGTVQITTQQGLSLFELMMENKGLALEEIWREFVIPSIKKDLNTKEEIVVALDNMSIKQVDTLYIPNEARRRFNESAVEKVISFLGDEGEAPQPFNPEEAEREVSSDLESLGNTRFFKPDELDAKTWKEVFNGFEWDVEIEVTNEQSDKQALLANLNYTLGTLASLGDVENARLVLSKVLEETDIFSPMELAAVSQAPSPEQQAQPPQDAPVAQEATPQLQT